MDTDPEGRIQFPIREKAVALGETFRAENGVADAINTIKKIVATPKAKKSRECEPRLGIEPHYH